MNETLRPLRWIVIALLSAGISGCARSGAATMPSEPPYRVVHGGTYVPRPTAELEYALEASTLRLPAGRSWPQHPMPTPPAGQPEWYQLGYARQAADRFWFCGWASVAVQATDPAVRRDAVATLQGITRLYYYTQALDAPSRPLLVTELATARRGDLAGLRNDLRRNC